MNEVGWTDPFADDETAREREQRRLERQRRRRERRAAKADAEAPLPARAQPAPVTQEEEPAVAQGSPAPAEPRRAVAERVQELIRSEHPTASLYRRRRLLVLTGLLAMGAVAVLAAVALEHAFRGGGGGGGGAAPAAQHTITITIPEGYDRAQIAELARKDGLRGDYVKASKSFKGFDPAKYGAKAPSSLEGFLFPATYDLPRHPTVDDLIARQLDALKQNLAKVNMSYARSKNLTPYDVLTIASMIEREVSVPSERSKVAAVIYNRLHDGMQLQIDATIRFAENNWTKPLTQSDLGLNSPYNTYTNYGLPPGPIGNPGLASIQAAAHPANVPYLYYVVKPCGNGQHYFTASYSAFQQAEARYNSARSAAAGRSPEQC